MTYPSWNSNRWIFTISDCKTHPPTHMHAHARMHSHKIYTLHAVVSECCSIWVILCENRGTKLLIFHEEWEEELCMYTSKMIACINAIRKLADEVHQLCCNFFVHHCQSVQCPQMWSSGLKQHVLTAADSYLKTTSVHVKNPFQVQLLNSLDGNQDTRKKSAREREWTYSIL